MPVMIVTIMVFLALLVCLAIGIPVAFALLGLSSLFMLTFIGPKALTLTASAAFDILTREGIMAIPLFVYMACTLEVSGVGEILYDTMYKWFGRLRGGLAIGTIVICTIVAATTGLGGTGVILMGPLAFPEMRKRGYEKTISVGSIVSGGALGALIPPSAAMVLIGVFCSVSVGKMFMGGVVPGLIMSSLFVIYIAVKAYLRPESAPAMASEELVSWKDKFRSLTSITAPSALIIGVLGSIYLGIATPTEAAAVGALGAVIVAAIDRKLNFQNFKKSIGTSIRITATVMWLLVGGNCFASFLGLSGVRDWVANVVIGMPLNDLGILLIMLFIVFILGMFVDGGVIIVLCIPIFMPIVASLGIDPLWFTILFVICIITGYLTPPFGMNIFYFQGLGFADVTTRDIYRAVFPYVLLMLVTLAICMVFPILCTWLPSTM